MCLSKQRIVVHFIKFIQIVIFFRRHVFKKMFYFRRKDFWNDENQMIKAKKLDEKHCSAAVDWIARESAELTLKGLWRYEVLWSINLLAKCYKCLKVYLFEMNFDCIKRDLLVVSSEFGERQRTETSLVKSLIRKKA